MKYLIIPDIHNRIDKADSAIELASQYSYDQIIFLGDYFDDFNDNPKVARKTALWLKESLKDKNRIHLFANHDLQYMYPENQYVTCSGFTFEKCLVINDVLTTDWNKLIPFYNVGDWLFSHAGFSAGLFGSDVNLDSIQKMVDDGMKKIGRGQYSEVFQVSTLRCFQVDSNLIGKAGITWCDWRELEHLNKFNQVVGHTIQKEPKFDYSEKTKTININLDCNSRYYGIFDSETGVIKTYKLDEKMDR